MSDAGHEGATMSEPDDGNAQVELMDLPEEMLVEVFTHLDDVQEVLRLRAVCRRWRDLLLHPDVWRRRSLADKDGSATVTAVLCSSAPCLKGLSLSTDGLLKSHGALAATTECAVEELAFTVKDEDVGVAAVVVRHQAALGRLRKVRLNALSPPTPWPADFRALLKTLCEVEGLTTLDLDRDYDFYQGLIVTSRAVLPSPAPRKTVVPSLVYFQFATWLPDAALEHILRCHAPTLEVVDVMCLQPRVRVPVAAILAEAPHLRDLRCPMLPDMVLLKKCAELRELNLLLSEESDNSDLFRDARALMREATQVERVEFGWLTEEEAEKAAVSVGLVRALAASKCSEVRKATFIVYGGVDIPAPPGLGGALAGLARLTELDVEGFSVSAAFCEAITPESVPGLRWLRVDAPLDECPHAWFHGAPVTGMLRRNRKLHLEVWENSRFCDTRKGTACDVCRRSCRYIAMATVTGNPSCKVVVFAHPHVGATCGEEDFSAKYCYELPAE